MFNPTSTYRIQFHKDFTFKQLKEIIPYLDQLGVKTLYASPIFEATPGSMHGYDVVNPLKINPEIGTGDELREISQQLKQLNISWLQDIVPNHMAFHPNNNWLMDVLENGKESAYADFFDIEWNSPIYNGRIMVPFLGVTFDEAIEQKQIQIARKKDKLFLTYYDQQYPLKTASPEKFTPAYIKNVNNDQQLLKELAEAQTYQLCHWQETDSQINYRRFFTVNGLICLNMQNEQVFTQYHQFIKQLVDDGIFQGLRVDHIDGLFDPAAYLDRLRELAGPDVYITVEKILETGEAFPQDWKVQGNTGYDFLAIVNNVFTQPKSKKQFTKRYEKLTGNKEDIELSTFEKKAYILQQHMGGELENLYRLFKGSELVSDAELTTVDAQLKDAIAQLLIHCPIYRFYGNKFPLTGEELAAVDDLFKSTIKANARLKNGLQLVRHVLVENTQQGDEDYNQRALRFYQRCMQFTGPLMAKGVEDTLMYTYNRFIGHNEVGDSPASFGYPANEFHGLMEERQRLWPLSINATSTHDTKRGEDVRARLNVLTDIPDEWFEQVKAWDVPKGIDKNDAYFIHQSIVGAHPMPQSDGDNFTGRLQEYLIKALREGKQNSDWAKPNEQYEEAVKQFIAELLKNNSPFKKSFNDFHQRVSDFGIINSLSQVLLKFTCPGLPDVYQGCDLWDLSLVDPDNRRPVDYDLRKSYLAKPTDEQNDWEQLWQQRYSGEIKLRLTQQLLHLRATDAMAFAKGDYLPLSVTGKYQDNVLAFARQFGASWYIIAVPLHLAATKTDAADPLQFDWKDTAITLPENAPPGWKSVLSGEKGYAKEALPVKTIFDALPLALLKLEQPADRGSGLLLHITSLPSAYGVGDIGPRTQQFTDFLFNAGQRYWQMLPVNPVNKGAGYSPYSASSSMAGNTLLISPELLMNDGWLDADDISNIQVPSTNRADFDLAVTIKSGLFSKAYQRFSSGDMAAKHDFEEFKSSENYWLEDFALYQVIKQLNADKQWYNWPKTLKARDADALKRVAQKNAQAIDREKWLQYVFAKQWQRLKAYAAQKGIILFGDMPFYISYDSVDVWANPQFFKLDKQGKITGIAGVPPDYFSADGQLWGMPVFNWEALKSDGYSWWLKRIRKNLAYFDLIRLDHFRAFADYWEVPGGEQTAVNGKWMPGPGADFFDKIKAELGSLPFVAEDLGDIDEAVHRLRDQYNLPGMRVLQFAFGDDLPKSDHIPHNYSHNSFAYTGTHDNNTLKGWYKQDINGKGRKLISAYVGKDVADKNVCETFIRLAYASVARAAVLPVQDLLELDATNRMNMPASVTGNWAWRLTENQLNKKQARNLRELTLCYNR